MQNRRGDAAIRSGGAQESLPRHCAPLTPMSHPLPANAGVTMAEAHISGNQYANQSKRLSAPCRATRLPLSERLLCHLGWPRVNKRSMSVLCRGASPALEGLCSDHLQCCLSPSSSWSPAQEAHLARLWHLCILRVRGLRGLDFP